MEKKSKKESPDEENHGRGESGEPEDESPDLADEAAGEEDVPEPLIKPVEKKVGESRDNLRGRESWFRRRSGTRY